MQKEIIEGKARSEAKKRRDWRLGGCRKNWRKVEEKSNREEWQKSSWFKQIDLKALNLLFFSSFLSLSPHIPSYLLSLSSFLVSLPFFLPCLLSVFVFLPFSVPSFLPSYLCLLLGISLPWIISLSPSFVSVFNAFFYLFAVYLLIFCIIFIFYFPLSFFLSFSFSICLSLSLP